MIGQGKCYYMMWFHLLGEDDNAAPFALLVIEQTLLVSCLEMVFDLPTHPLISGGQAVSESTYTRANHLGHRIK